MKKITQTESFYIRVNSPESIIKITSVPKGHRGKNYYVEETFVVQKLLADFAKIQESKTVVKYGKF